MRVLMVEDQVALARPIVQHLNSIGFVVDHCTTVEGSQSYLETVDYDAIILDRRLPDGDGAQLLPWLASRGNNVPVLIFSILQGVEEKIYAFDKGAEDYVHKGTDVDELAARLRVLGRRGRTAKSMPVQIGHLHGELLAPDFSVQGRRINLPRRESSILVALMMRAGRVVSHEALEAAAYSLEDEIGSNVIEANISRLRRRLDEAGAGVWIKAVRGLGYFIIEADQAKSSNAAE